MTTATIRVGYEYRDCGNSLDGLVWHIETTKMSGHDLASTDMGGWNLHVQHKYNFHSGILQKGDGNTIYLKYKPQVYTWFLNKKDFFLILRESEGIILVFYYFFRLLQLPWVQVTHVTSLAPIQAALTAKLSNKNFWRQKL